MTYVYRRPPDYRRLQRRLIEHRLLGISTIIDDASIGLAYRYQDANNHWRFFVDTANNQVVLEKIVASAVTEVATAAVTLIKNPELRIFAQGNRHRGWYNHVLLIDTTDGALNTATKCGLYFLDTTRKMADDFAAQAM